MKRLLSVRRATFVFLPGYRFAAIVAGLAAFGFLQCSSSDEDRSFDSESTGGVSGEFPNEKTELKLGALDVGDEPEPQLLDPFCGSKGICLPDDSGACDAAVGGAGGATQDDSSEGIAEIVGGAAGGVAFDPGDLGEVGAGCHVRVPTDCDGEGCDEVVRSCGPSGSFGVGEPCVAAADCESGLACVGEGVSGVCQPYCCEGTSKSCSVGNFCDHRPLLESPEFYVPVCIAVDDCPLTDPFPCPDGVDCICKMDRACVVVRPDGATACASPGSGQSGDSCTGLETAECAHGFVCSPNAGCMKLCSTVEKESSCPEEGTCQSPSEFPSDLGVCVGVSGGPPVAH